MIQEPAENASEDAVRDWESHKQRRDLPGLNSEVFADSEPSEASTPAEATARGIFVELQSKSDFLRSRPDFGGSDVIVISSSQISHFPHSSSQIELPPSQFVVASSHPSLDFVADSQPVDPATFETQETKATTRQPAFSQTTIPDSQDFSTDLSQDPNSASFTGQGRNPPPIGQVTQDAAGASARAATHYPSFNSSIPSRQPGTVLGSFGTHSIPGWEEGDCLDEDGQHGSQTQHSQVENAVSGGPASSFEGFFTQVEFGSGNSDLPSGARPRHQSKDSASQSEQPSNTLAEVTPADDSQQAAQIVSPLAAEPAVFHTQNEEDFFTASEDYEVVPDTSKKDSGRNHG